MTPLVLNVRNKFYNCPNKNALSPSRFSWFHLFLDNLQRFIKISVISFIQIKIKVLWEVQIQINAQRMWFPMKTNNNSSQFINVLNSKRSTSDVRSQFYYRLSKHTVQSVQLSIILSTILIWMCYKLYKCNNYISNVSSAELYGFWFWKKKKRIYQTTSFNGWFYLDLYGSFELSIAAELFNDGNRRHKNCELQHKLLVF